MTRDEALTLWGRLTAHWPRLGGPDGDVQARERAQSWVRALMRVDARVGWVAVDQVIVSHRDARLPVFGDVQEAARQIARTNAMELAQNRRQLEAGTFVPADPEWVAGQLDEMRAVCQRGKHQLHEEARA